MCVCTSFQSVDPAMLLHTHVCSLFPCLPPPPDVSLRGSSPCVLLRDGCCKPLSSERFQLSHFFRVHGAGFSPLHQIFIEGETGEAGSPRALLSSTHLTSIPLFRCPLNLPDSLALILVLPRVKYHKHIPIKFLFECVYDTSF